MYMLAGGADASNTDPYAQKSLRQITTGLRPGPHVMIVGAKGLLDAYPRSPRPDTSVPYVMWPDTPYEACDDPGAVAGLKDVLRYLARYNPPRRPSQIAV